MEILFAVFTIWFVVALVANLRRRAARKAAELDGPPPVMTEPVDVVISSGETDGRDETISVAGTSYRQGELRSLLAEIDYRSVQAALVREPENPHDPDAVAVYVSRQTGTRKRKASSIDGVHVGYWPRLEPRPSVPDTGLIVRARLVGGDDGKNVGCRIYRDSIRPGSFSN